MTKTRLKDFRILINLVATSEKSCKFFFFPFKTEDNNPCLDALVSKEFRLIKNERINLDITGFIIKYIHYFNDIECVVPSHIVCKNSKCFGQSNSTITLPLQQKYMYSITVCHISRMCAA